MQYRFFFTIVFSAYTAHSFAVKCSQAGFAASQGGVDCVRYTPDEDIYTSNWVAGERGSSAIIGEAIENAVNYANAIGCAPSPSLLTDWVIGTQNGDGGMTNKGWISYKSWYTEYQVEYFPLYLPQNSPQYICPGPTSQSDIIVSVRRSQKLYCPSSYSHVGWFSQAEGGDGSIVCFNNTCPSGKKWSKVANGGQGKCVAVRDTFFKSSNCPAVGNPMYPLGGNKREVVSAGAMLSGMISLDFIYDSNQAPWAYDQVNGPFLSSGAFGVQPGETPLWGDLGKLWWLATHQRMQLSPNGQHIRLSHGDGKPSAFNLESGSWLPSPDTAQDALVSNLNGYLYIDRHGLYQEQYNSAGLMQVRQRASGMKLIPNYLNGNLQSLSDPFGRHITFTYKTLVSGDVAIETITDPALHPLVAGYDTSGNLTSLTWQDGTVRGFVYDSSNSNQWWAMTGVVRENAKRYSTFRYDAEGWIKSTEHAGGVDKYEVSYATPPRPSVREVYDAANEVIWRHHEWKHPTGVQLLQPNGVNIGLSATTVMGAAGQTSQGSIRSNGASQPAGAGCGASSSNIAYDSVTGNVLSQDDFNGMGPVRNLVFRA